MKDFEQGDLNLQLLFSFNHEKGESTQPTKQPLLKYVLLVRTISYFFFSLGEELSQSVKQFTLRADESIPKIHVLNRLISVKQFTLRADESISKIHVLNRLITHYKNYEFEAFLGRNITD